MFSFHRSYFEIDFGKMCIGTDCQALSTFLLPKKMLSISVYRTLNEQTKSYKSISYLHCHTRVITSILVEVVCTIYFPWLLQRYNIKKQIMIQTNIDNNK